MKTNVPNETKPVSQDVRDFLGKKPFITDALHQKIVNYTALARLIHRETGTGSIEAIQVALIREKDALTQDHTLREKNILKLLKKTKVTLQDKIAVIIAKKELDIPHLVVADLGAEFVYIIDQTQKYASLDNLEKDSILVQKNLVALILKSPEKIKDTPGVVAFISQLLASKNINMREFLSFYTDTLIVLEMKDALKAFSLLQGYI